jgi:hypothetical protein
MSDQAEQVVHPRSTPPQRRIVCAAIRNAKGEIICGARHYDKIMRDQLSQVVENNANWDHMQDITQGFIDQRGVFLDRREAWLVAAAASQIIRRVGGDSDELFSENLY